jgi:leucyl-tRNA synthetase
VARLGADTVRMYLAFIGPYNEVGSYPWNPDGVVGVRRFLERVWKAQEYVVKNEVAALESELHRTMKKVGEDIQALKFNTAIAQLMIFLNLLERTKSVGKSQWQQFLELLAPFAPHIAEELWHEGGYKKSVHVQRWPTYDETKMRQASVRMAVQINGKTRAEIEIEANSTKETVEQQAREAAGERLQGKTVLRTVVVPGRLVNFVVQD